jgi:hypothetical protein
MISATVWGAMVMRTASCFHVQACLLYESILRWFQTPLDKALYGHQFRAVCCLHGNSDML